MTLPAIKRLPRSGGSLLEVFLASIMLVLVLLPLMYLNSSSNRIATNAYYEFLAFQIAQEPLEFFKGQGFKSMSEYSAHPHPDYSLGSQEIEEAMTLGGEKFFRPRDSRLFRRTIELSNLVVDGFKAVKVEVTVSPRENSTIQTWFTRDFIKLSALIVDEPI